MPSSHPHGTNLSGKRASGLPSSARMIWFGTVCLTCPVSALIKTQVHWSQRACRWRRPDINGSYASPPLSPSGSMHGCHSSSWHHRTTSYTSCSVRSPDRCRPHSQARRPGTTAPGPRPRLFFLLSTRHTSSRHSLVSLFLLI